MTPTDISDPLFRRLAQLPFEGPPAESAHRVRARCHAALARQVRQGDTSRTWTSAALIIQAALLAALCLYLVQAATVALQVAR